jgi:lysophospholipase L1-like esterase
MRRALPILVFLAACKGKSGGSAPPPPPITLAAAITVEARDAAPAPVLEPPSVRSLAKKKVLHIGDSMVGGTFGLTRALEAKLTAEGATIVRHTTVSETLQSFDKSPTLKDLIRTHQPDIVVITLGANDALVPHPEAYTRNIENIARRVGDRECWWIGPPSIQNSYDMKLVKVLAEHSGSCKFFDSSKLELERTSDGIHPNDRGAGKWADAFWASFQAPANR